MKPAADSWWTDTVRICSLRSYSASSRPRFPCPHRPTAYGTRSRMRYSVMISAPFIGLCALHQDLFVYYTTYCIMRDRMAA